MGTKPVKKAKARRSAAFLVVIIALLGVLHGVDRLVLHPWSFSITGAPTLLGYWEGEATLGPNDTRRFALHLYYDTPRGRCGGCSRIDSAAVLCAPSGAERYELHGNAENHSGSRFSVAGHRTSGGPGKVLERLDGEWTDDRITIRTTFHLVDAAGTSHWSTADGDRQAVIELRRGDKAGFERDC